MFLVTLVYLLIVAIGILVIKKLHALIPEVRAKKEAIDKLDKELYTKLRDLQFNAKYISRYTFKLLKKKNSLLGELLQNLVIYILPFKKVKSLLLLLNVGKKIF